MRLLSNKILLLITTGIIQLLTACEKDKPEPTYDDGVLTGTITFYQRWPDIPEGTFPLDNVTVKVNGPYGSRTVLTNADGEYEMNHIGNGTYEIEFLKKGWGATKLYSVQIFGNEVLKINHRMWKFPDFDMPVLDSEVEQESEEWVSFRTDMPAGYTEIPRLRAFYSETRDVSCFKYEFSSLSFEYSTADNMFYQFRLPPESHGRTVYIIVYLYDIADNGEFDPFRGVDVFPSINPDKHSPVIEYKIH